MWNKLRKELLSNPKVKEEYDRLQATYDVVSGIIGRRRELGMTQQDLADKLGVPVSEVAKLESLNNGNYSIKKLQNVADALDSQLRIQFVPSSQKEEFFTAPAAIDEEQPQEVIELDVAIQDGQLIFKEPAPLFVEGNGIRFGDKLYVLKLTQGVA